MTWDSTDLEAFARSDLFRAILRDQHADLIKLVIADAVASDPKFKELFQ